MHWRVGCMRGDNMEYEFTYDGQYTKTVHLVISSSNKDDIIKTEKDK